MCESGAPGGGYYGYPGGVCCRSIHAERDSMWYMFFEIFNRSTRRGVIGVATSPDGCIWKYGGVVLDEAFHLSYPYAFEYDGSVYMIPESGGAKAVLLYRAVNFRCSGLWLIHSSKPALVDNSIFQWDGRWWMFATESGVPSTALRLRLFTAESLFGPGTNTPRVQSLAATPTLRGVGEECWQWTAGYIVLPR